MNPYIKGQKETLRELKKLQRSLNKAQSRALNKTARQLKTRASKEIRAQINLKAAYVKSKLDIILSKPNSLKAKIKAQSRGMLLTNFPNRQLTKNSKSGGKKNAGISLKIKKTGSRVKMKGAFYIKLKNSNKKGIALRKKGAKGRSNFKVLHGPSVSQVWKTVKGDISHDGDKILLKNTLHEIDYELNKGGLK